MLLQLWPIVHTLLVSSLEQGELYVAYLLPGCICRWFLFFNVLHKVIKFTLATYGAVLVQNTCIFYVYLCI